MRPDQRPIVVAVPGGDDEALLRYAAWEALLHGCGLRLVHVSSDPEGAERVIAGAVARAEVLAGPGVAVDGALATGAPVSAVLERSTDARVVVVRQRDALHLVRALSEDGWRGPGPAVSCVPSGWTADPEDDRPVLVGVDDPGLSRALLARALEIAHCHGATARFLHAWSFPRRYEAMIDARIGERWSRDARSMLTAAVDACRSHAGADVPVEIAVERGGAADVLVEAARHAQALVLERNPTDQDVEHVGRTTRAALHACPCPVVLLPPGHVPA